MSEYCIVSYGTDQLGKDYARWALELERDCAGLGLEYDIEVLPHMGTIAANTSYKPTFIYAKLLQHRKPIIWCDVDGVFTSLPVLTKDHLKHDIGLVSVVEGENAGKWSAGCMLVNWTSGALQFLVEWAKAWEGSPDGSKGAAVLNSLLGETSEGGLRVCDVTAAFKRAFEERVRKEMPPHKLDIVVEQRKRGGHEEACMEALVATCKELGHKVRHDLNKRADVAIVWNGRNHLKTCPTVICELGWAPRWNYQLSWGGINASNHMSGWEWDGLPVTEETKHRVAEQIAEIKAGNPRNWKYTQVVVPENLPEEFLLVPMQIETDTNMAHVPEQYRNMQGFMQRVIDSDPPYPLVVKGHPAQHTPLGTVPLREGDVFVEANQGTVYGILQQSGCKGVVTLNSNTVHDAMIYGIPSIVIGNHMWPRTQNSCVWHGLPEDWGEWEEWVDSEDRKESTVAYLDYLRGVQWTLEDCRDRNKVQHLIRNAKQYYVLPEHVEGKVNVVVKRIGWLFDDLQDKYNERDDTVCTEFPVSGALAYMFIRTGEGAYTPDPRRTVVQIHDFYANHGDRGVAVKKAAGLVLTHPDQAETIDVRNKYLLPHPIGASSMFSVKTKLADRYRIGWVGRASSVKRINLFAQVMKLVAGGRDDVKVVLLGDGLAPTANTLANANCNVEHLEKNAVGYENYPDIYKTLDLVMICSSTEAGPLCLFEALASGVPVVATPVGWAPRMILEGVNGYILDDLQPQEIAAKVKGMIDQREDWFARRFAIRGTLMGYTLEDWIDRTVEFAKELGSQVGEVQ